jgi:uncharacterized protein YecA (UPF0149 family)
MKNSSLILITLVLFLGASAQAEQRFNGISQNEAQNIKTAMPTAHTSIFSWDKFHKVEKKRKKAAKKKKQAKAELRKRAEEEYAHRHRRAKYK